MGHLRIFFSAAESGSLESVTQIYSIQELATPLYCLNAKRKKLYIPRCQWQHWRRYTLVSAGFGDLPGLCSVCLCCNPAPTLGVLQTVWRNQLCHSTPTRPNGARGWTSSVLQKFARWGASWLHESALLAVSPAGIPEFACAAAIVLEGFVQLERDVHRLGRVGIG